MTKSVTVYHNAHKEVTERTILGFWHYIMSDCILFATLFVTYAVLHNNTYGGPTSRQLFDLPYVLTETLILLTSSLACGLGLLEARRRDKNKTMIFFGATFLLGLAFLALEINEFYHLVQEGNSWQKSAFLSAYFTLVGTHGLHVASGLLWILVLMAQAWFGGLTWVIIKRFMCLSLFWHFLDIVWIFIFTLVYLMGVIL
jgi:cytochrome o ubiquinol oxidase subunit III